MTDFNAQVERNLRGIELEKSGREDEAVRLYEENVKENSVGNHPYDRLAIIYRKRMQVDEEIRVLEKAIWVFDVLYQGRGDGLPKLGKFKRRLEKAKALKAKVPEVPEPSGAVCPYCKQILDKTPKRKKKCPHCGKYIYLRSLPTGDHQKVLVTEDRAKEIEKEWETVQFRKKWMQSLQGYGLSAQDFDTHREMLRERFGQEPGDGDIIWSMFNDVVHKSIADAKSTELKLPYFEMALFLYQEGRGFVHLLEQSHRMELTAYKRDGILHKVFIITAGDASCEACQKLEGKVFTVDEALEQMPLPCKDCTFDFAGTGQRGWCRCLYGAVVD